MLHSNTFVDNTAGAEGCALYVGTMVNAATSELFNNTFLVGAGACTTSMIDIRNSMPFVCARGTYMPRPPLSVELVEPLRRRGVVASADAAHTSESRHRRGANMQQMIAQ